MLLELSKVRQNLLCFAPHPDQPFSHPSPEWFFFRKGSEGIFHLFWEPFLSRQKIKRFVQNKKVTLFYIPDFRRKSQAHASKGTPPGEGIPTVQHCKSFPKLSGERSSPSNKLESSCGCQGGLYQVETIREGRVTCIVWAIDDSSQIS